MLTPVQKRGTRRSLPQAQIRALEPQARAARRARIVLIRCPASAQRDRERFVENQLSSAVSLSGKEAHVLSHNLRTWLERDACQRSVMQVGMQGASLRV